MDPPTRDRSLSDQNVPPVNPAGGTASQPGFCRSAHERGEEQSGWSAGWTSGAPNEDTPRDAAETAPEDAPRAASMPSSILTPDPTPSALIFAHQESSPENEEAVSPACANDTASGVPPRGDQLRHEKPQSSTTRPAPGTKPGTTWHADRRLSRARSRAGRPDAGGARRSPGTGQRAPFSAVVILSAQAQPDLSRDPRSCADGLQRRQ